MRLIAALCLLAAPAVASEVCHPIVATQGWQTVEFPAGLVQGIRSEGFWTVLDGTLGPAGTNGHTGTLAADLNPDNHPRIDEDAGHGALLVRIPLAQERVMTWKTLTGFVTNAGAFNMNLGALHFRINEADSHLADNAGQINVCFTYD
ncbi:hypothetical protein [Tropicibacter naphthalenivorans]|uniref:Uncharacterized protein n=1 Tax=Tropicibacter naphthalenivorans TaxID=441103 RepID=A0A0P1GAB0_9RHOB|nr:hypothetical protein [Tropicibacter naphthalenivorans]CUH78446.1 hypothetical protein TRN7648_01981 [Tropicibacter naphthalenivorans]SMC80501.1 hypothetical protein SAMN04488093_104143 [Tropicibacter naphthalenivorans]